MSNNILKAHNKINKCREKLMDNGKFNSDTRGQLFSHLSPPPNKKNSRFYVLWDRLFKCRYKTEKRTSFTTPSSVLYQFLNLLISNSKKSLPHSSHFSPCEMNRFSFCPTAFLLALCTQTYNSTKILLHQNDWIN